jgi:hypothetical protein
LGPCHFFAFLILYTYSVGLLGRVISPSKAATCTQTSMPVVGLEPTTPMFERAKTARILDRAAGHCDGQIPGCNARLNFNRKYYIFVRCAVYRAVAQSTGLGNFPDRDIMPL